MSIAYECQNCYSIMDKDEVYRRHEMEKGEYGDRVVWDSVVIDACPYCGHDHLEDIALCETCELNPVLEGHDDCESCIAKSPSVLDPWMDALRSELDQMVRR